jgi:hypothetical protein
LQAGGFAIIWNQSILLLSLLPVIRGSRNADHRFILTQIAMKVFKYVVISWSFIIVILFGHASFSQNAPITTCATVTACSNTYVTVPVTVTNFNSITAITLWILYDTTYLRYDAGTTSLNASIASAFYGITQISGSTYRFSISWVYTSGPVSLTNGSILATIGFFHKSGSATLTFDNTSNGGHDCEYASGMPIPSALNDIPTSTYYINGAVNSGENGGSVSGGGSINYGSSTGTLTATGYVGTIQTWQRQYAGGGYSDIGGTAGQTTYSETPSCTGVYDYRVVAKYGSCAAANSTPATVTVTMTPGNPKVWNGSVSDEYTNPSNWTPCGVPQTTEDIDIPAAVSNFPTVRTNGYTCKNILVESGATLTVNAGIKLTVNGTFTLQP